MRTVTRLFTRAGWPVRIARERRQAERFARSHPELSLLISQIREERLTFLRSGALRDLATTMTQIERQGLSGEVVEAGAALGGSAIVLAAAKSPDRPMRIYDTFGMIPPPSGKDGADVHERYAVIASGNSVGLGGDTYYGYHADLQGEVINSFKRFGLPIASNCVELIAGLYEETLRIDFPVVLAHIDCDWYESVATSLARIDPHLVPGGRFVIDDYDDWSGCRLAVDEFLAVNPRYSSERLSRLHLVKRQETPGDRASAAK